MPKGREKKKGIIQQILSTMNNHKVKQTGKGKGKKKAKGKTEREREEEKGKN